LLQILSPTLNLEAGQVGRIPIVSKKTNLSELTKKAIEIVKLDWDSFEYSWNFKKSDILNSSKVKLTEAIEERFLYWRKLNQALTNIESQIDSYYEELYQVSSEVKDKDNSLNPSMFRGYISKEHTAQLACKELVSYAIGCIMARYSLSQEGLVYAHSKSSGLNGFIDQGVYGKFLFDNDAIVPLTTEEWLFEDDATVRFREFVKTIWGEEHLSENLEFVAESLCLDAIKPKKNESSMDTIRRYFSTQFYKDHLKTYKKRPIYWLFSSGKEKAFECLVYLHRYNESTLARMRTEYVTPLMGKMEAQHKLQSELEQSASSTAEKKRLQKEIKSIEKKQAELRAFDEELKHLAEMKISINLDDGVKVNYGKFGNLLHDVKGIHGKKPAAIK
jgi:type II restriction/modification system DNA methylase subunit YeeA